MIFSFFDKKKDTQYLFFLFKNFKKSKSSYVFNCKLKNYFDFFVLRYLLHQPIFYFIDLKLNFMHKFFFLLFLKNSLIKKNFFYNKFSLKNIYIKNSFFSFKKKLINLSFSKLLYFNFFLSNINCIQKSHNQKNSNFLVDGFFCVNGVLNVKNSLIYIFKHNQHLLLKTRNVKKKNNYLKFLKFMINTNDRFNLGFLGNNLNFFSNKYLINHLSIYDNEFIPQKKIKDLKIYNNYYPVLRVHSILYEEFSKKFKFNKNINFIMYTNKIIVNFLENFIKKKIYIKIINNYTFKIKNVYFNSIINDYKNFRPLYFKKFFISDFIQILWYSFLFKDLKMISNWISVFMESLNFKNHKKFLSFFNNFLNKYSSVFTDVLGIKGFFFDIRGKVGVTGSSKKRHLCFKFGKIKKSGKKYKLNFKQNLVRTYSGVMGLTYIISY